MGEEGSRQKGGKGFDPGGETPTTWPPRLNKTMAAEWFGVINGFAQIWMVVMMVMVMVMVMVTRC